MWSNAIKSGGGATGLYSWEQYTLTETGKVFDGYKLSNKPDAYPICGLKGGKLYLKTGLNFSNASWADVNEIVHSGYAGEILNIGDLKDVTLTNGEVIALEVADFNHDTYTAGEAAPVTFIMKECIQNPKSMNPSNYNNGGWEACYMRSTFIPQLLEQLPADLKVLIKPIDKVTTIGGLLGTLKTTSDKLWLLSEIEAFGTTVYSPAGEGTKYPIFTDNTSRIKRRTGSAGYWWLRSSDLSGSTGFVNVGTSGGVGGSNASSAYGLVVGLCI